MNQGMRHTFSPKATTHTLRYLLFLTRGDGDRPMGLRIDDLQRSRGAGANAASARWRRLRVGSVRRGAGANGGGAAAAAGCGRYRVLRGFVS